MTRAATNPGISGAKTELLYSAKLWLKEATAGNKQGQTRDVSCIVNELADATYQVPFDVRTNEIVHANLSPQLKVYKKAANGGPEANPVVKVNGKAPTIKLNEPVRPPTLLIESGCQLT